MYETTVPYINTQSARNKVDEINVLISESKADFIFLSETWFNKHGDEPLLRAILPKGYKIYTSPRIGRRGGGLAVIYRNHLQITFKSLPSTSFECISTTVASDNKSIHFVLIYRPPPSKKVKTTFKDFVDEFQDLVTTHNTNKRNTIFLGDFNIHFDAIDTSQYKTMQDIFTVFDLKQLVDCATHTRGHIIDWVIVPNNSTLIDKLKIQDIALSDHHLISCSVDLASKIPPSIAVCTRKLRTIDSESFGAYVSAILSELAPTVENLNQALTSVIEKHAPEKQRTIPNRQKAPWIGPKILKAKQEKRKAERRWRKNGLVIHKEIFKKEKSIYIASLREAKKSHIENKLSNIKTCRELFAICDELLGKNTPSSLPNKIPEKELPGTFQKFFNDKIEAINEHFNDKDQPEEETLLLDTHFSTFNEVSENEVRDTIMKSVSKHCELDPIPTYLLKDILPYVLSTITDIINHSIRTGFVDPIFKKALVKPLIKKTDLDPNVLNHFRPISNLPFISKVLEKIVLRQLLGHLDANDLRETYQSAYRTGHNTETALLMVMNDLMQECDTGSVSILALLDLSAAFDTIDHTILLNRLSQTFGLSGSVLMWFTSYIEGRFQSVKIGNHVSDEMPVRVGVPQGSVLGPVLFSLYMKPLSKIFLKHSINYHMYADDTQLFTSSSVTMLDENIQKIELCVMEIKDWMCGNKLKLNEDKTEIMVLGTSQKLKCLETSSINFGDVKIDFKDNVKNLGVYFDSQLTMSHQINSLLKICYFELRKVSHIRQFLSYDVASQLVTSLVLLRLDYCNCLLGAITTENLNRLQLLQNNAARLF